MRRLVRRGKYVLFPIARRKKKRKPVAHSKRGRLGPTNRSRRNWHYENRTVRAPCRYWQAKTKPAGRRRPSPTYGTVPYRAVCTLRADRSSEDEQNGEETFAASLLKQAQLGRGSFYKVPAYGSAQGSFYFSTFRMRKVANTRKRPPLGCTGFCANKNRPCMQAKPSTFHPYVLPPTFPYRWSWV